MDKQATCKVILGKTKSELLNDICILIFGLDDCTIRTLETERAMNVWASDDISSDQILDSDYIDKIYKAMKAWAERWVI